MIAARRPVSALIPASANFDGGEQDDRRKRFTVCGDADASCPPVRGSRSELCRKLAIAGELKSQNGDLAGAVEDFEAALKTGTQNLHLMGTVYSQLGNSYFYLGDLKRAADCHRKDLSLSHILRDANGEMKACSNLSSVFRQLGQFDEAISCAKMRLQLSKELADKSEEMQSLYVIANHHHAKAKALWTENSVDAAPEEVAKLLRESISYYKLCLPLTERLKDVKLRGRVCGHLGNILYLLGHTQEAVKCHSSRLEIAREEGDMMAMIRSYNNLANALLYQDSVDSAESCFTQMMELSEELDDQVCVAKALYGLATVHACRREYTQACALYKRQIGVCTSKDRLGELQALFGLTTSYRAMEQYQEALHFATEHQAVAKELHDAAAIKAAEINISALEILLAHTTPLLATLETNEQGPRPLTPLDPTDFGSFDSPDAERRQSLAMSSAKKSSSLRRSSGSRRSSSPSWSDQFPFRRASAESSPRQRSRDVSPSRRGDSPDTHSYDNLPDEQVLDLMSRMHETRLDFQRAPVGSSRGSPSPVRTNNTKQGQRNTKGTGSQLRRSFRIFKGSPHSKDKSLPRRPSPSNLAQSHENLPDERDDTDDDMNDLFDCLEVVQGRSIDDQRASLPTRTPRPPDQSRSTPV